MFSHVCWHRRLGEVQHSFTSAGRAAGAGPQGGRRWPGRQPPPPRGGEGPRNPEGARGRREQGKKAEEVLDGDQRQTWRDRRHSKEQEKSAMGTESRASAGQDGRKAVQPREGRACGPSKAGWGEGLGQAGTSQGSRTGSRPPVPPTDAGAAEGVPLEARLAVTAVGAGEVVAYLPLATAVHARLTLIHICRGRRAGHPEARTLPLHQPPRPRAPGKPEARGEAGLTHTLGPVLAGVVATPADHWVPLARVGAHRVDAAETWPTWLGE